MKLLKPLPKNRTLDQITNHFNVEKSIAKKLRKSNFEERKIIYATMYDELFRQVPDHPRITKRKDKHLNELAIAAYFKLFKNDLSSSTIFLEFGPGDCKFALEVAKIVETVYAVDISDQTSIQDEFTSNFIQIIYDGYQLDEVKTGSVDIVFSNQLIEHFHPEDLNLHFELVHRILINGGKYIFITPHAYTGPHDISQYFSNQPQGFHLREWTFHELVQLLHKDKFSKVYPIWYARGIKIRLLYSWVWICESMLKNIRQPYKRVISRLFFPTIFIVAIK